MTVEISKRLSGDTKAISLFIALVHLATQAHERPRQYKLPKQFGINGDSKMLQVRNVRRKLIAFCTNGVYSTGLLVFLSFPIQSHAVGLIPVPPVSG